MGKGGRLWCLSGRVKGGKRGKVMVAKVGGLRMGKGRGLWWEKGEC